MHYSPELAIPDFSSCQDSNSLMFAVLKEMQQTNYLECYYDRFDRASLIIDLWNKRSMEMNACQNNM
jgi:hypothetical protein